MRNNLASLPKKSHQNGDLVDYSQVALVISTSQRVITETQAIWKVAPMSLSPKETMPKVVI
jgi:hypothetical protein